MARFKPSEQWANDAAQQLDPRSDSRPDVTSMAMPDLRGPIDVALLREAVSERMERWIGTLWMRRIFNDGCELPLIIGGRFTEEFAAGLKERLSLPVASADGFLNRLAAEFKDWAKGSEWKDEYTELSVSAGDQDVTLRWDRTKNTQMLDPDLEDLDPPAGT